MTNWRYCTNHYLWFHDDVNTMIVAVLQELMQVSAEVENSVAVYTATAVLNNILIFRGHMNSSTHNETLQSQPHESQIIQCRRSNRWTDGGWWRIRNRCPPAARPKGKIEFSAWQIMAFLKIHYVNGKAITFGPKVAFLAIIPCNFISFRIVCCIYVKWLCIYEKNYTWISAK